MELIPSLNVSRSFSTSYYFPKINTQNKNQIRILVDGGVFINRTKHYLFWYNIEGTQVLATDTWTDTTGFYSAPIRSPIVELYIQVITTNFLYIQGHFE